MYVYTEKDLENIRKEVLGKIADQRYELDITILACSLRVDGKSGMPQEQLSKL